SVTIPASPFMQKLGFGTGVSVYLMKRSPRGLSRSPWAVKKINSGCSRSQRSLFQRRLQEEAQILRNLRHPNIVGEDSWEWRGMGILGLWNPSGMGVLEWGSGGLWNPLGMGIPGFWNSSGMGILGVLESLGKAPFPQSQFPIPSNPIRSHPIPPDPTRSVAVSDPELCYVGTEPWKPPEALEPGGIITDRSDIFPFGLTLWEMLALSIPHLPLPESDTEEESFSEESFDEDSYYAALGTRPPLPPEALDPSQGSVLELFSVCTCRDPGKRPSAAQILRALEPPP
ncbi:TOPK kinase, partial [Corvus moneduloides]|nr:TOPK kinase [Corvus moneduloides]